MGSLCLNSSRKQNDSDTTPVPQSKKSRVNNQDKAKLDIRARQRQLKDYQKKLEKEREQSISSAKELAKNGQKSRAMIQIRLKKMYDKNIQKAQNAHYMLQETYMNIESVENDAAVLKVLQTGDQAIKELKVDVSEFERIKENMDQYQDKQEELGDILKDDGFDEEQLLQDLKALDDYDYQDDSNKDKIDLPNAAMGEVKSPNMSQSIDLPDIPQNRAAMRSPDADRKNQLVLQ